MNTLKQLQEKAREIWENKAEDFTYEDLDNITTLAFEAGKAEARVEKDKELIESLFKFIQYNWNASLGYDKQEDREIFENAIEEFSWLPLDKDTLKTKLQAKE